MGDQRGGGISWTDQTWNPIRGCTRVSPGCENCYAERAALRSPAYNGLVKIDARGRPAWTGEVAFVPELLDQPLHWRRPRKIFVNSMSDLFHEKLSDDRVAEIFAVMAASPRHTFQVLTKRAERMCELLVQAPFMGMVAEKLHARDFHALAENLRWPLPNLWLGVSVEDQRRADERLPLLAAAPAEVKWISAEPLLEQINVRDYVAGLDWIVVGGESGPRARPFRLSWAYDLQYQAALGGASFFLKQLGSKPINVAGEPMALKDWHGKVPEEWPEELREQEFPQREEAA